MTDASAIGFELGFARAPGADAAAEPRQCGARADEPRQQVLELRQLDLQLAFARPRAAREDVENQLRAIEHLAVERLLEVAKLRRAQLVVEDDDIGAAARRTKRERLDLAAAEERRRIGLRTILQHAQDDGRAGGRGEAGKLVERMFGIELAG